ncbi:MAG: hypothetical protein EOO01_00650 [Chitinophagaceae bacterium]|nr:MAG: hypothetical protein EOO01_00650 [Chitinophagaceae bacterium]
MKKLILLLATGFFCLYTSAQTDSVTAIIKDTIPTVPDTVKIGKRDTLRIGNILIIKKSGDKKGNVVVTENKDEAKKKSRVTTNWWIVDLGFANYSDQTDYSTVGNYLVNRPGTLNLDGNDFKLKAGKSVNVNIWFFMQRLALIKRNVNLKYGLGLELNNYRYKSAISYRESGEIPYTGGMQTNAPFIFRDSIGFSKNKLAADYLTVPLMLNFRTTPSGGKKSLSVSFGVSAGYLYSQRNKQKSDERGKLKNKGDYDLNRFKFSYIGELGLGPVKLYGSYSPKSMYDNNMDFRPYSFGVRIGSL